MGCTRANRTLGRCCLIASNSHDFKQVTSQHTQQDSASYATNYRDTSAKARRLNLRVRTLTLRYERRSISTVQMGLSYYPCSIRIMTTWRDDSTRLYTVLPSWTYQERNKRNEKYNFRFSRYQNHRIPDLHRTHPPSCIILRTSRSIEMVISTTAVPILNVEC